MTEINIAPEFLGVFVTLIIFLISFSVDNQDDKKTLWRPVLLILDTPISLATGITLFLSGTIYDVNWWIGIVFILFSGVLGLASTYYGLDFAR